MVGPWSSLFKTQVVPMKVNEVYIFFLSFALIEQMLQNISNQTSKLRFPLKVDWLADPQQDPDTTI